MGGVFSSIPNDLKSATVNIVLDNSSVKAGERLQGVVGIEVTAPMKCDAITIQCIAEGVTAVYYRSHQTHVEDIANQRDCLYKVLFTGPQFPSGDATLGSHHIPFLFDLPSNAPSSFSMQCHEKNTANYNLCSDSNSVSISYLIRVYITVGKYVYMVHAVPFQVLGRPVTPSHLYPIMTEDTQRVKRCCCFNQGNITLGAKSHKNAYSDAEEAYILVEVDNQCSQKIRDIQVSLMSKVEFSAGWHRYVSLTSHGVYSCGPVDVYEGYGARRNPPTPGHRFKLLIPPFLKDSVKTKTLSITYFFKIHAQTGSCITNPEIRLPITMYQSDKTLPPHPKVETLLPDTHASESMSPSSSDTLPVPTEHAPLGSRVSTLTGVKPLQVSVDTTGDDSR